MDFYEAVEKRRTIRRFRGPATQEQLHRILIAGTKAPSPMNRQDWEFILVDDPGLVEKISERKYVLNRGNKPRGEAVPPEQEKGAQMQKDSFADASLVVVYHRQGATDAAGAWMAVQNISLAAAAEGLGSRIAYFSGGADKDINQLLQVPEGYELAAALSIGIPAAGPVERNLRPEGSWLHRNRF